MNNFAGTFTFLGKIDLTKIQDKHLIIPCDETENTNIFVFGKTKLDSIEELVKSYGEYGELDAYDVSISSEDNMTMLNNEIDKEGVYEVASFESANINLRDITQRFQDSFEVICVREAEESEKFGNRVIRVDFIY
ncbi:hypothetical protein N8455_00670 [Candidatus Gracilibacteria bacterium]|nr:hypothetical protein [Candidatus Gracilibacteria bacterium]